MMKLRIPAPLTDPESRVVNNLIGVGSNWAQVNAVIKTPAIGSSS
jgi:hypothetical protein